MKKFDKEILRSMIDNIVSGHILIDNGREIKLNNNETMKLVKGLLYNPYMDCYFINNNGNIANNIKNISDEYGIYILCSSLKEDRKEMYFILFTDYETAKRIEEEYSLGYWTCYDGTTTFDNKNVVHLMSKISCDQYLIDYKTIVRANSPEEAFKKACNIDDNTSIKLNFMGYIDVI